MTDQPTGWQAPGAAIGPAAGIAFAGPGDRLVAYIVDVIIVSILTSLLAILTFALAVTVPILAILPFIAIVIVPLVYFPYYWSRDGQTPGMKMMDIRVVRDRDYWMAFGATILCITATRAMIQWGLSEATVESDNPIVGMWEAAMDGAAP